MDTLNNFRGLRAARVNPSCPVTGLGLFKWIAFPYSKSLIKSGRRGYDSN